MYLRLYIPVLIHLLARAVQNFSPITCPSGTKILIEKNIIGPAIKCTAEQCTIYISPDNHFVTDSLTNYKYTADAPNGYVKELVDTLWNLRFSRYGKLDISPTHVINKLLHFYPYRLNGSANPAFAAHLRGNYRPPRICAPMPTFSLYGGRLVHLPRGINAFSVRTTHSATSRQYYTLQEHITALIEEDRPFWDVHIATTMSILWMEDEFNTWQLSTTPF